MEDENLFDFSEESNVVTEVKTFSLAEAGVNSYKLLEVSESEGNLDFKWKGCERKELGNFSHRTWANVFDKSDVKYQAWKAKNAKKQVVRLCEAYLSPADVQELTGKNAKYAGSTQVAKWGSFVRAVVKKFASTDYKEVVAEVKVVLTWNDAVDKYDNLKVELSSQDPIISTDLKPYKLKLNDALNKKGDPYERFLPLDTYLNDSEDHEDAGNEAPGGGNFAVTDPITEDDMPF